MSSAAGAALWPGCTGCGEAHGPIESRGAVCDLQEESPQRVTALCPYHEVMEPATRRTYYDTVRDFFDCGAFADHGYGEWRPPESARPEMERRARARTIVWSVPYESSASVTAPVLVGWCSPCEVVYEPYRRRQKCDNDQPHGLLKRLMWKCPYCEIYFFSRADLLDHEHEHE